MLISAYDEQQQPETDSEEAEGNPLGAWDFTPAP
jgi:hypothetical protein